MKTLSTSLTPKFFWLLIAMLFTASCSSGLPADSSGASTTSAPATAPPTNYPSVITDEQTAIINLYASVNPSVVNITVFGQHRGQLATHGGGSGFVFGQAGYIVTNDHVIEGADQIEVTFSDGTIKDAKIVGQDPHSDLAVIKVDQLPTGVSPLPLGDMVDLAVGQSVVAIGNPFGLDGTLTLGVISALGRTIPAQTPFSIPQAIQTDAAINPGNSGGPLLDLQGRVIGVTAQIETGGTSRTNSGVGFAIPVSIVGRVVPALIEDGRYEWAWLGVRGGNITPTLVDAMKLPVEKGAYVVEIIRGGPADQAGLRGAEEVASVNGLQVEVGGDVVTAINEQSVRSFDDLLIYITMETEPGQEVKLTILRNGETREVSLRLGVRPMELES